MAGADERLAVALAERHPDDAARLLERAEPADAAAFLADVPASLAAGAFRAMSPAAAVACCALIPDSVLAGIVAELPLDVAATAMRRVDSARRESVIMKLPESARDPLRRILSYADDSAAALADPIVVALPEDMSVSDALRQLRTAAEVSHLYYYIYVVARDQRLTGVMNIAELMAGRGKEPLSAVMHRDVVHLDSSADLATVAVHPAWRDFDALPVTDSAGHLLGAIRHKSIRRLDDTRAQSVVAALMGLSELYWAGLSGMLTSISVNPKEGPPTSAASADIPLAQDDKRQEGDRGS